MAIPYRIEYAPAVIEHLRTIERRSWSAIRHGIEVGLIHQPDLETRNRKRLARRNALDATWELRLGPNNRFRAFYDIHAGLGTVEILAIGVRRGSRLWIGGEEFGL